CTELTIPCRIAFAGGEFQASCPQPGLRVLHNRVHARLKTRYGFNPASCGSHGFRMTLHPRLGAKPPRIPDRLVPLLEAAAPHFTAAEMKRRRIASEQALSEAGASHALVVGPDRRVSALQRLSELPSSSL